MCCDNYTNGYVLQDIILCICCYKKFRYIPEYIHYSQWIKYKKLEKELGVKNSI